MSQSSAFDRTQFGNVLDNHSDFRATRYRRQADKGEEEFARNDGSVLEGADWDNVMATLEEFHTLLRNMEVLNRGLLSLINAARALGFATPFVNEASRLRDAIADLYFFIQLTVVRMQYAWFNHEDFNQFTIARSANLVLHHSLDRARTGEFTEHVDRVSRALERLDELAVSVFKDADAPTALRPLFNPVANQRNTPIREPQFYPRDHPLPTIIKACNSWMPGITAVLEQWTNIDIPSLMYAPESSRVTRNFPNTNPGRDQSQIQSRQISILQNISTVAIFFSGVSATTLQYNGQLQTHRFLWLLSLVLSTASAIQCQLAIYWHTSSQRRTPKDTVWIVRVGASEVPLILLGISSVAFLIGLAYFSFTSSSKHSFVAIGITLAICLVGAALFAFILLLVRENKLSEE